MKNYRQSGPNHQWTKDEVKKIIKLWDTKSTQELADEMGLPKLKIQYIANAIRNAGYKLPKKHQKGYLHFLLKEVIAEVK